MLKKFKTLAKDWVVKKRKKFSKNRNFRTLTMCEKCFSFYYHHSWHFKKPAHLEKYHEEEVPVTFTQCPACLEQENALYEAESGTMFKKHSLI